MFSRVLGSHTVSKIDTEAWTFKKELHSLIFPFHTNFAFRSSLIEFRPFQTHLWFSFYHLQTKYKKIRTILKDINLSTIYGLVRAKMLVLPFIYQNSKIFSFFFENRYFAHLRLISLFFWTLQWLSCIESRSNDEINIKKKYQAVWPFFTLFFKDAGFCVDLRHHVRA